MQQMEGKVAFIAGAGRNNGRAISIRLASEGANLIMVARKREAELNEAAQECEKLGAKTLTLLADLSNPEEVNRSVKQGITRFGKIDSLVSCPGLRPHKDFWDISYEEWNQVLSVNLSTTFYLAKAIAPGMMERKSGSIVALGGMASLTSQPQRAHVIASKSGLYGLIKALALELGPYNVRANLIALNTIENKRLNPEWYREPGNEPLTLAEVAATALKRKGSREEVANVALFLASDQSSYVTGDRIICAGGRIMQ